MPGEHLPDPPIPDVPAWRPMPAARRGSYAHRVVPGSTAYVPGGPVTAPVTGLDHGDLVVVRANRSGSPHAGAVGTIFRFRPALSTGTKPVSIRLTKDCPCPCGHTAGGELLVSDDRLELLRRAAHMPAATVKAPAKATLPEPEPEPEPEPPPPPPGVSTEYPEPKPRYLFVAIPLTDDPAEDPTDATELIDLIAERHEHIRFEAHELTDPEETS